MLGDNPLVSVCIPAYNHEDYIEECVQSIIDQSYQNIELLIVNDGSKDQTWNKIQDLKERCEARFSRVDFETQENQGTCITFNKLFSKANGKYIYLIASDDRSKPTAIMDFVDFLENNPEYGLVVGNDEMIDGNSCRIFWDENRNCIYHESEAKYKTFAEYLILRCPFVNFKNDSFGSYETLLKENYVPNGYLLKSSLISQIGPFTTEAPLEDWWLMLQISKYSKLKYLDKILFSYRWHSANTMKQEEKISRISKQTFYYEDQLANEHPNESWAKTFKKLFYKSKFVFKFGNKFSLFRENTPYVKREILTIFGKQFILKEKNKIK